MFAIPIINGRVPSHVGGAPLPATIAHVGALLADMDAYTAPDLRTGAAGPRRMIEKVWQRWYAEAGLPARLPELPVSFSVLDAEEASLPAACSRDHAWLALWADARPARWYIGEGIERHLADGLDPLLAEHAIGTLYAAADALAYVAKPPEFLAWARAFWWNHGEDAKPTRCDVNGAYSFPTRRRFDNRYPPICQAPRRFKCAPVVPRGTVAIDLARKIADVQHGLRAKALLRPNAHLLKPDAAAATFAAFIRWKHGDYLGRLVDTYFHVIERHRVPMVRFVGAWPLATADDITRAQRGIEAHARLSQAAVDLLHDIGGYCATSSMGGHW